MIVNEDALVQIIKKRQIVGKTEAVIDNGGGDAEEGKMPKMPNTHHNIAPIGPWKTSTGFRWLKI